MISKKIILIGAMLFYSCSSFSVAEDITLLAKQPDFDMNGLKLGDKLTEEFFNEYCPTGLKGHSEIECKQKIKLKGIKISILYFFYKEKLLAVSFNYPSSEYSDLIEIYTKKFAQPPHNAEEPIILGTGVKYTNKKASWNTTSGEFVIEQYWNNFKRGSAHLASAEYEEYKKNKIGVINESIVEKIFGDIFD